MSVVATICARGGSKGVPGKNLRPLAGKPLIAWTIACAQACPDLDGIVISTDDDRLAAAAEAAGVPVPFRRPPELASDTAAKLPVIRHAAAWWDANKGTRADIVLDLDVTVPLRAPTDISAAIKRLRDEPLDVVMTVYEPERNPYFNMVEMHEGLARVVARPARPIFRRQDAPKVYSVTPAVFGFRREFLDRSDYVYDGRVGVVELPRERAVDIDHEMDFRFVEFLMKEQAA